MQNVVQEPVWKLANAGNFSKLALHLFQEQYAENELYQSFVNELYGKGYVPDGLEAIPFLPIEFFKTHVVKTGSFNPEKIFRSSGTTATTASERSKRVLRSIDHYRQVALKGFEDAIGNPAKICILGLLPSYLERDDASLVQMVDFLIKASGSALSGFYLDQRDAFRKTLQSLVASNTKTVIFGVSFALLDLLEEQEIPLSDNFIVVETGGMKGRRKEMIKVELYSILKQGFGLEKISSEYGMTELLSQAYAEDNGLYKPPPWMRVLIRENTNPLEVGLIGKRGGVNIIDLANTDTCAFIQTSDLGLVHEDATFEIIGRLDNTDIRGCSQMI